MNFRDLQAQAWQHELDKGFHEGQKFDYSKEQIYHVYSKIALTMSELAELIESMRAGTLTDQCNKNVPLSNAEEELADAFIRLGGLAALLDIDNLDYAIEQKMQYNKTRPIKHGKNS